MKNLVNIFNKNQKKQFFFIQLTLCPSSFRESFFIKKIKKKER
jgi:hypothetical protein